MRNAGGQQLSGGWQATLVFFAGGNTHSVTDWETACNIVRDFLGLGEPAMSDTGWDELVCQDGFGEWLIPLNIDRMESLALEGSIEDTGLVDGVTYRVNIELP